MFEIDQTHVKAIDVGFQEIQRMRRVIATHAGIVRSFFRPGEISPDKPITFERQDPRPCCWGIMWQGSRIVVNCSVYYASSNSECHWPIAYSTVDKESSFFDTMEVYDSLPFLLESMAKAHPMFVHHLAGVLKAAERADPKISSALLTADFMRLNSKS